jgi:hypothetical protein
MFTLNLNLKPKTMETNSISDVFAQLKKAELMKEYLWLQAKEQADKDARHAQRRPRASDYLGDDWRSVNEAIDVLYEEIEREFLAVAVHVAGQRSARVLVADMDGEYLMGLQDYNYSSIEVQRITKPLYDALIENQKTN